jgi:hypothetical protein
LRFSCSCQWLLAMHAATTCAHSREGTDLQLLLAVALTCCNSTCAFLSCRLGGAATHWQRRHGAAPGSCVTGRGAGCCTAAVDRQDSHATDTGLLQCGSTSTKATPHRCNPGGLAA